MSRSAAVALLGAVLVTAALAADGVDEWLGMPDVSWRLTLVGPQGVTKEVACPGTQLAAKSRTRTGQAYTWSVPLASDAGVTVTVTIRTEKRSSMTYWSLKSRLPSGWTVVRCDFPFIPRIRSRDGLSLAVPAGWGLEYDVKPGLVCNGAYPSCTAGMQFVAFHAGGRGLYIGMHDPRGLVKLFTVKGEDDGASFLPTYWPAVSESVRGTFSMPYETAICSFEGDYYDAAQIYRDFTFRCPWGKGGAISTRPIPRWLKDTDLWLMSELEPWTNMQLAPRALELFGIPIALHWYRWSRIPFDTLYPDYFPPKPGFAGGIEKLQSIGMHVMPYINGRLCDPESSSWRQENLEKAAVRLADGKLFPEVYETRVPLNVMCPGSSVWQTKIAEIGERLARQYEVDAVYVDQIACAGPVLCSAPNHGHPAGDSSVWVLGYRRMLDELRRRIGHGLALATEENAECYIDKFDLQLMANTPTSEARPIPLFPAVYSGRSLTYGFQYNGWDDIRRSLPFRAKTARAFVWGAQLGWVRLRDIVEPDARKEAQFLRDLARCRRFGHHFVVTGRFLGMLEARGDFPRLSGDAAGSFGGTYKIDLPAVLASSWLSEDGVLGILVVNMSDDARKAEMKAPIEKLGRNALPRLTVTTYGPEGLISRVTRSSPIQQMEIPARSALILSLTRE